MSIRVAADSWQLLRPLTRQNHVRKHLAQKRWSSSPAPRQWSTPLAKTIAEAIATTGPISLAAYMRQCLTSPEGGYYTQRTQGKDQFGQKGDFITSPEISQVFGELVGIWLVAEWMAQGKRSEVDIIEVGPGRGTLMDDLLRTIRNFKQFASNIRSVCLVEASPALRETQRTLLCGDNPFESIDGGVQSTSKHLGIPIKWFEDIRFVPQGASQTPFIFAHEFFDALPIHAFQSVPPNPKDASSSLVTPTGPLSLAKKSQQSQQPQWRELVVTIAPPPSKTEVDFQLSLARASTPPALLLPTLSDRYKALLSLSNSTIEISPESHSYAAGFARRIGNASPPTQNPHHGKSSPAGAALILDYGPSNTVPISTLRGIRAHKPTSPFSSPGLVDLSADVDFTALAEAALAASPSVEIHGPVEQGMWLEAMGIRARAEMICRGMEGDEDGRRRVMGAVERLVERGGGAMGRLYKVMAIVPERGGKRPVGFGGSVG